MIVFVAGGTGVLGRATVRTLVEAGHRVRSTGRGEENAKLVRSLGAEPVDVDLYDESALRRAIAGSDAVLRLTTKIPPLMRMRNRAAWKETNRLRTIGARTFVDAAIAADISTYIHESVTFVYAEGGSRWLDEDGPTDDGGTEILGAVLKGEQEAVRFSKAGGRGIVLRFGAFYGSDAPSTAETVTMVKRRMLPRVGTGRNYMSSIYVPDAARAVAAVLGAPAGIYNVCDDNPVPFAEYLSVLAAAVGAPQPLRLPAVVGRWMFGDIWRFLARSQRVSNAHLKEVSGWAPRIKNVAEGWPLVASQMTVKVK